MLSRNLIKFHNKKDYLKFNVYFQQNEFFIKGEFSSYNYELEFGED